tara:strand:- start:51282 stop:52427 length:1146 start_codon:yes stop_codon:yes gene_type:complete
MVQVGIIGAGAMGQYVASLLKKQSPAVQFSNLFDPDPEAVHAAIQQLSFTGDVAKNAAEVVQSDCDWVMIASLNSQHADHTIAAFEAGKHVFCQKPLATTFKDCLRMRDAWLDSGRQFVIGFTLRYSPHYRKIKQLLQAGEIGEIISLEFNETLHFNHGGFIHGDWRRHSRLAGSHVLEKCSHDIDIVNWLVDSRASRVASFGGTNFFTPENAFHIDRIEQHRDGFEAYRYHRGQARGENPFLADKDILDNQVVILEFENRVRATFHMSANTAIPERRLYICGTEGTLRADVMTGAIELQQIGFHTETQQMGTGSSGMHGGGDPVLAAELFQVMTGSGQMSAGIDAGLSAATTCFAIDEAVATGQVVDLADYWRRVDMSPS